MSSWASRTSYTAAPRVTVLPGHKQSVYFGETIDIFFVKNVWSTHVTLSCLRVQDGELDTFIRPQHSSFILPVPQLTWAFMDGEGELKFMTTTASLFASLCISVIFKDFGARFVFRTACSFHCCQL